jgi:hypothetical protein
VIRVDASWIGIPEPFGQRLGQYGDGELFPLFEDQANSSILSTFLGRRDCDANGYAAVARLGPTPIAKLLCKACHQPRIDRKHVLGRVGDKYPFEVRMNIDHQHRHTEPKQNITSAIVRISRTGAKSDDQRLKEHKQQM